MKCQILSTLYVKSNGEITCECDAGERVSLGWVKTSKDWSIEKIVNNEKYQTIRRAFTRGSWPWKEICSSCAFLRTEGFMQDRLSARQIKKVQIEPSLLCSINCPCCSRVRQLKERPAPHLMQLDVFQTLLRSCSENDYSVEFIEYCGQGEPLSHPDFAKFIETARSILPGTKQRLITNGNYDYHRSLEGQHLDEIYVSCDGLFQESYEKYRINGSVDKALKFMADAKSSAQTDVPLVVWKYILFEFNNSDEELIAAQKKAMELGIDSLSMILTHTEYKSQRFNADNLQEIPIISPIVVLDKTPIHDGINIIGNPVGSNDSRNVGGLKRTFCVIDEVRRLGDHYLTVRGWAMGKKGEPLKDLVVYCDQKKIGEAMIDLPRQDVMAAFPMFRNVSPGFFLTKRLHFPIHDVAAITLKMTMRGKRSEEFEVIYRFDRPGL